MKANNVFSANSLSEVNVKQCEQIICSLLTKIADSIDEVENPIQYSEMLKQVTTTYKVLKAENEKNESKQTRSVDVFKKIVKQLSAPQETPMYLRSSNLDKALENGLITDAQYEDIKKENELKAIEND